MVTLKVKLLLHFPSWLCIHKSFVSALVQPKEPFFFQLSWTVIVESELSDGCRRTELTRSAELSSTEAENTEPPALFVSEH